MPQIKVLLVEDNPLLRRWILSSLENAGLVVVAPETFREAARLAAASGGCTVLITDWQLEEGHTGFEILEFMNGHHPPVLSILMSADCDAELEARARRAGFNCVMQKPLRVAEIVGAVQQAASEARIVA